MKFFLEKGKCSNLFKGLDRWMGGGGCFGQVTVLFKTLPGTHTISTQNIEMCQTDSVDTYWAVLPKGRPCPPKWMNFQRNSEQTLTPNPPGLADCPAMSSVFVCWHSRKWWPPIRGGQLQLAFLRLEKAKWTDFFLQKRHFIHILLVKMQKTGRKTDKNHEKMWPQMSWLIWGETKPDGRKG